ncbi:hypothetical protein ACO0SA_003009 [Hanseniaspora valbyensis]
MTSFFKPVLDIDISVDDEDNRIYHEITNNKKGIIEKLPIYEDGESVSGMVTLRVRGEGRRVEHNGITISLIGLVEMKHGNAGMGNETGNNSNINSTFLQLTADLYPPGELLHTQTTYFNFKDVQKQYNSYKGKNVDLTYCLKVKVLPARNKTPITKYKKIWCELYDDISQLKQKPVKLDIGIENCLHIEFEFGRSHYTLDDLVMGRVYFLLSRLKIKNMELSLITRETISNGDKSVISETIPVIFEIMDGSPVKGETIPIRLFLSGYNLLPSMELGSFSVKNYLSLVIYDEDGRRYFKQAEIFLHRTRK